VKRPAFQFYPGDWLKDAALRSCSLEARGLWMDMISHMHQAEPYGHLVLNGKPVEEATLARMVGSTPSKVRRLIEELERSGTCSRRDDGALYSRRMVKDEQLRNERAEFGRLGGNPKLLKGKVNPPDKPKQTPSSSSSSSSSEKRENAPAFLLDALWCPDEETMRMRLTLAGRPPTWTAANVQGYIANERPKGVSKTQAAWTEGFVKWMLREPAFSGAANSDGGAAIEAFAEVRQRIRDGKPPGNWKHPQTDAALDAVGGWQKMKYADSKDNDFRERPFVAAFNQARAA